MKKLIIEARINEYTGRDPNPHVPYTAEEIAEDAARCREEGASVVHFHARRDNGDPDISPDAYACIIRTIRARSDILVHPTLGSLRGETSVTGRLRPFLELAADTALRPDFVPLCLSSPNWDFFDTERSELYGTDKLYLNSTAELCESARLLTKAGMGISCVCWEVGAIRRLLALIEAGLINPPVYLPFHLTSGGMLAGHPGTVEGLDAHLAFLPAEPKIEWAVINLHGSMMPLLEKTVSAGGHVQIGVGDYHYSELGLPSNAELVRCVARIARDLGREIATPEEAERMLKSG